MNFSTPRSLLVPVLLLFLAGGAHAATLSVTLSNMAGETLAAASAAPVGLGSDQVQNILAAPILAGGVGTATLVAAEDECLFDLVFTFASGKTTPRPATDICQTDGIVLE